MVFALGVECGSSAGKKMSATFVPCVNYWKELPAQTSRCLLARSGGGHSQLGRVSLKGSLWPPLPACEHGAWIRNSFRTPGISKLLPVKVPQASQQHWRPWPPAANASSVPAGCGLLRPASIVAFFCPWNRLRPRLELSASAGQLPSGGRKEDACTEFGTGR
jgi:hypothetical protein